MALRLGQHAGLHVHRPSHHRIVSVDLLQPQRSNRVGKRLLHTERDDLGLARARHSSLFGPGHGRADGLAPDPGGGRRRIPRPARNQLLARPDPDANCPGLVTDRLSAALGSKGLLRHAGLHGDHGGHAHRRSGPAAACAGGAALRPSHSHPVFRHACRDFARITDGVLVSARLHVPATRHYRPQSPACPGFHVLARPGAARRGRLPGRFGGGLAVRCLQGCRVERTGRSFTTLFGRPPRMVFLVPVSVLEIPGRRTLRVGVRGNLRSRRNPACARAHAHCRPLESGPRVQHSLPIFRRP